MVVHHVYRNRLVLTVISQPTLSWFQSNVETKTCNFKGFSDLLFITLIYQSYHERNLFSNLFGWESDGVVCNVISLIVIYLPLWRKLATLLFLTFYLISCGLSCVSDESTIEQTRSHWVPALALEIPCKISAPPSQKKEENIISHVAHCINITAGLSTDFPTQCYIRSLFCLQWQP